jgi:hypothetical protein
VGIDHPVKTLRRKTTAPRSKDQLPVRDRAYVHGALKGSSRKEKETDQPTLSKKPSLEKKGLTMKNSSPLQNESASELISNRIKELDDWRGQTLSRVRKLITEADPEIVEEWKWRGVPVWSHDGIVCTGETYKNVVKLTFAKGASLNDADRLFNASLDGNVRRAIDISEGDSLNEAAFKKLIRTAVSLNLESKKKR